MVGWSVGLASFVANGQGWEQMDRSSVFVIVSRQHLWSQRLISANSSPLFDGSYQPDGCRQFK